MRSVRKVVNDHGYKYVAPGTPMTQEDRRFVDFMRILVEQVREYGKKEQPEEQPEAR